jgi:hypothetical protein
MLTIWKYLLAILAVGLPYLAAAASQLNRSYRYLPGDPEWPSDQDWAILNKTVGGNLIKGVPVAQPCYGVEANKTECLQIQNEWVELLPL